MKFYIKETTSDNKVIYWLNNLTGATLDINEAYAYDGEKAFEILENDRRWPPHGGNPLGLIPVIERD